uniref:Uncharacterized protein n=1 Tax=Arundo donax TaxID=35708 RepID=A0A0A9HAX1_ARUDO
MRRQGNNVPSTSSFKGSKLLSHDNLTSCHSG